MPQLWDRFQSTLSPVAKRPIMAIPNTKRVLPRAYSGPHPNPGDSGSSSSKSFNLAVDSCARRAIVNHMVEHSLDATFAALSDPTRRGMLAALIEGERSVGELAEPYDMSFAGAAKHVAILERAGLIQRRKMGRHRLCRLKPAHLKQASDWLDQWESFWNTQLDALEAALANDKQGD